MARDHSATSKLKLALIEAGKSDVVINAMSESMYEVEDKVAALTLRVQGIENKQRELQNKYTDSGVWEIVRSKLDARVVGWTTWAFRGAISAIALTVLSGIIWLIQFAWTHRGP